MRYIIALFVLFAALAGCAIDNDLHPQVVDESDDSTISVESDTGSPADADADTYIETGTDTDTDIETDTNTNIETDTNTDTDTDTDTGSYQGDDCNHEYIWYFDADGDRYGASSPNSDTWSCDPVNPPGPGYVDNADDCDDTNPDVHPGAEEVCDWIPDNNCDGILDTGDLDGSYDANGDGDYDDEGNVYESTGADGYTWCFQYHDQLDTDGDGYCSSGMDLNGDGDCTDADDILFASDQECPEEYHDCDVMDSNVHPGAEEIYGDGIDNNCDGIVD